MALECLFTDKVVNGKQIAVHPEATHLRCKSGDLLQFKCNPMPLDSMREIPKGTNYVVFNHSCGNHKYIDYGIISFVSHNGNILKQERY
ncbi:MAG: hypothetical protein WC438_02620 [Candidatus Pacearchaeota archaeon]